MISPGICCSIFLGVSSLQCNVENYNNICPCFSTNRSDTPDQGISPCGVIHLCWPAFDGTPSFYSFGTHWCRRRDVLRYLTASIVIYPVVYFWRTFVCHPDSFQQTSSIILPRPSSIFFPIRVSHPLTLMRYCWVSPLHSTPFLCLWEALRQKKEREMFPNAIQTTNSLPSAVQVYITYDLDCSGYTYTRRLQIYQRDCFLLQQSSLGLLSLPYG